MLDTRIVVAVGFEGYEMTASTLGLCVNATPVRDERDMSWRTLLWNLNCVWAGSLWPRREFFDLKFLRTLRNHEKRVTTHTPRGVSAGYE